MFLRLVTVSLLSLSPLAAHAAATDDLAFAIGLCFDAGGDTEQASAAAAAKGWAVESDADSGLATFYPQDNDQTVVTMALDGSFCQAESMTVASDVAAEQLQTIAADVEYDFDKSDMGCTMLNFGTETATILSGGQDPTCGSDENSAVRFESE